MNDESIWRIFATKPFPNKSRRGPKLHWDFCTRKHKQNLILWKKKKCIVELCLPKSTF